MRQSVNGITDQEPIHLSEKEAARILGFSPRTLQGWRLTGRGPRFVRVSSRCVRYRMEDLVAWSDELRRTSTADDGLRNERVGADRRNGAR